MPEVLQIEVGKGADLRGIGLGRLAGALADRIAVYGTGFSVADNLKKLSGPQLRASFAGMQFTDEVHWRDV